MTHKLQCVHRFAPGDALYKHGTTYVRVAMLMDDMHYSVFSTDERGKADREIQIPYTQSITTAAIYALRLPVALTEVEYLC